MKYLFTLFTILFIATTTSYAASDISNAAAINVSGKQRMLSQRMAKCYIYASAGFNISDAEKEKRKSILLFEENLRVLNQYSRDSKIDQKLNSVSSGWKKYKKALSAEYSEENAKVILSLNTEMLKKCHAVVVEIENYTNKQVQSNSKSNLASTINKAGKQRMLSQRFALYYMAFYKGYSVKEDTNNLKATYNEFDKALSSLLANPANTLAIDDKLIEVITLWKKVRDNYIAFIKKEIPPAQVYNDFNDIMSKMNTVTRMYTELDHL